MPLRPLWPTAAMHPLLSGGRQPVGTQVLDLPASSVRDVAASENPVDQWGRPFQPELRATGRQIAEQQLGMQPGWGSAAAGLGLEVLLDPGTWLMAGAAGRKLSALAKARQANRVTTKLLAQGAMPAEVAAATRAATVSGKPTRFYHGTEKAFEKFDFGKSSPGNLYGSAAYFSDDPAAVAEYTNRYNLNQIPGTKEPTAIGGNVRMAYIDTRNPLNLDVPVPATRQSQLPPARTAREALQALRARGLSAQQVQEAVKASGFDALTSAEYMPGVPSDRTMIPLSPSQIYGPWVAPPVVPEPSMSPVAAAILGYQSAMARQRRTK